MQGDLYARELIFNVANVDPARRQRLVDLLDIDLEWRMHRVSDGQRRRVQICMGLLKPFKVLLLDEVCFQYQNRQIACLRILHISHKHPRSVCALLEHLSQMITVQKLKQVAVLVGDSGPGCASPPGPASVL
jgi:ABC-type uncharacterized transport system ATPase subunit